MSDHPVLIPTSLGPVEGMVSEPEAPRRAALMFVHGAGRDRRSGINAVWARMARDLADLGVAVLRADFGRRTESNGSLVRRALGQTDAMWKQDVVVRHEIAEWWREKLGTSELWVAGSCYGARVAIHLAARNPAISRLFLIVPFLRRRYTGWQRLQRRLAPRDHMPIHRLAARDLIAVVDRIPVAVLYGEHDGYDPVVLRQQLGAAEDAYELELIPGLALHPVSSTEVQAVVLERTIGWASRSLAEATHRDRFDGATLVDDAS